MAATTKETDTASKQKSYFKKEVLNRYVLDDKESFIEHSPLDEGLFQSYQDITSKIKLDRDGESTEVDMALGKQRKFLLENLVQGWNLVSEDSSPLKYTPARLAELPPEVITGLVEDIYSKNPILSGATTDDDDESGKEQTT